MSSKKLFPTLGLKPAFLVAMALVPAGLFGEGFLAPEEALRLAFPLGEFHKETFYLTTAQRERATQVIRGPVSGIVTRFRVIVDNKVEAFAYLDTHKVRTLPETLLVILTPRGELKRVEVVSFSEPKDYLPRRRWYDQFESSSLQKPPKLGETIRPVSGATLTAHATSEAVRRVLALHQVLTP